MISVNHQSRFRPQRKLNFQLSENVWGQDLSRWKKKKWSRLVMSSRRFSSPYKRHAKTVVSSFSRPLKQGYRAKFLSKQRVQKFYPKLTEKAFKRSVIRSVNSKSETSHAESVARTLEKRVSSAIYRMGLATSFSHARQLVVHGRVLVNGCKVKSPGALLSVGDQVTINFTGSARAQFVGGLLKSIAVSRASRPRYFEVNLTTLSGVFIGKFDLYDIPFPVYMSLPESLAYYRNRFK